MRTLTQAVLDAIAALVDDSTMPYADKKAALFREADNHERDSLVEFISWFDETDVEEGC